MSHEKWRCPLCKAANVMGSKRCSLCRRPCVGTEERVTGQSIQPKIREKAYSDPDWDWEEDSKVLKALQTKVEEASKRVVQAEDTETPSLLGLQIVIPNNFLGWVKVAVVVVALAAALAIIRTMM